MEFCCLFRLIVETASTTEIKNVKSESVNCVYSWEKINYAEMQ